MCVRVCVCICVYIPRYSRASLIIRYRGSNTISRKCNKLAVSRYRQVYTSKPFRMSLSSLVDLLPYRFRNILSYLSVEIEIDLESNWYRRSRTAQLGFEQRLLNNLCNNVPNVSIPPRDSRNFTIFLPPLETQAKSFDRNFFSTAIIVTL